MKMLYMTDIMFVLFPRESLGVNVVYITGRVIIGMSGVYKHHVRQA